MTVNNRFLFRDDTDFDLTLLSSYVPLILHISEIVCSHVSQNVFLAPCQSYVLVVEVCWCHSHTSKYAVACSRMSTAAIMASMRFQPHTTRCDGLNDVLDHRFNVGSMHTKGSIERLTCILGLLLILLLLVQFNLLKCHYCYCHIRM